MTDAPDLTPEQEAVRRLLADARHDGPPPPEVVARLDDTLAALVADRGETSVDGVEDVDATDDADHTVVTPVTDLGARRRRLAGMGVLAAAAVVVAGVALGQALPRGAGDSADSGASQAESSAGQDAPTEDDGSGTDDGSGDAGGATEEPGAMSSELAPDAKRSLADAPRLSSTDAEFLDQQLLRLRTSAAARSRTLDPGEASLLGDCLMAGIGPGRRAYATLDDVPVVVVYGRPSGDAQTVSIYACGEGAAPLRRTVLPAP